MLWLVRLFYVLLIASAVSFGYLYNYANFKDCRFPSPSPSPRSSTFLQRLVSSHKEHGNAPFRLLAFGDPQLEGDTSIAHVADDSYSLSKLWTHLREDKSTIKVLKEAGVNLVQYGIPAALQRTRKQIDLIGNDYYLAHIYRTLSRQTNPTHVAVLGDLLGSQWIDDAEFERRAARYWQRVFKTGIRVDDEVTKEPTIEVLNEDKRWKRRIINIAGNHDIGYAGDINTGRVARFERAFGAVNWEIVFEVPGHAEESAYLRLVILNTMNLDSPAQDEDLQGKTYEFLNDVISRSEAVENRAVGTVLLTHIPLHKQEGICVDGPYFSHDNAGRIREQNHLSEHSSRSILEGIFGLSGNAKVPYQGLGRKGIIINGHDHEGCDVWHYLPRVSGDAAIGSRQWNASTFSDSFMLTRASTVEKDGQYMPGMREVTLRSMMGEYGGWAYLISGWFDTKSKEWVFEVNRCSAGVQHIWWAVHILVLVTAGLSGILSISSFFVAPEKAPFVSLQPAHRRVPSIKLSAIVDEESASPTSLSPPALSPPARPPSPFDHFNGNMELSGGRARKRRPT